MKKTVAILMFLIVAAIMLLPNSINAETGGAVVKITTDNSSIEIGDTVTVTVSQYETGGTEKRSTKYVEFGLAYNTTLFKYNGLVDPTDITATDTTGNIAVSGTHEGADISSVSFSFTALEANDNAYFKISDFKSGESAGDNKTGNYNSMQAGVKIRPHYEGVIAIKKDKDSVPVERKVNISLAQTEPTNYIEATISYDSTHFEFIAPAHSEYEADTATAGKVTIKATGTDLKDVTLLFKGKAETGTSSSSFTIESYKAGADAENASRAHLYNAKSVSVAVTPRNQSVVRISSDLTDDTATIGDIFVVTVSQDKATDFVQYDLIYDPQLFAYVGLGDNESSVTTTTGDDVLGITASGKEISEVKLKFQALKVTDGLNNQGKAYIKVSNFFAGDNAGDTDTGLYNIQQLGVKVIEKPAIVEPEPEPGPGLTPEPGPELGNGPEINEIPQTGTIITTLIAAIIAEISIAALVLRRIFK